jgi:hypothetical protein
MGVDPRLRPNSSSRKSRSEWRSKSKTTKRTEINVTKTKPSAKVVVGTSAKNQKDLFSIVSNSIVASRQPPLPRVVAVKTAENKRYDDASYGSEGQSETESKQSSMRTKPQAPVEQNLVKYVYEGLANLANVLLGEEEQKEEKGIPRDDSGDDSQSTKTSKSSSVVTTKSSSVVVKVDQIQSKQTSNKSLSPTKKSKSFSGMVSEISIPTPNKEEESIDDDVSILGLDKRKNKKKNTEDSENYVPQQTKKKGKSRAFGKILGRKTKA